MSADSLLEIIVKPHEGATGTALAELIDCLGLVSKCPVVVVIDVECNGNRSWVGKPGFATNTSTLLDYARSVGQFDWATFFFFREDPKESNYGFLPLFASAEHTIRAIDSACFYIYCDLEEDFIRVSSLFPAEYQRRDRKTITHPS